MKMLLLTLFLLVVGVGLLLRALNLRHLARHGATVPEGFEGVIDGQTLSRTSAYTLEGSRLGLIESLVQNLLRALFLFGGLLPLYDRWIASLTDSPVGSGVAFFLALSLAGGLLDIPFSLYRTFRLEARYGFNAQTLRLWLGDLVKGTLISVLLGGALLGGAFWLISASPAWWWLWVWAFFACFTLFVMYLSPYLIEPLFFKFEPLRDPAVESEVRALMERAGLRVSRVFQVDASRRSRHSNAYFTGIGRVKRIVLFDTLLEQMTPQQITAILAHEIGHWKGRHLLKGLATSWVVTLGALFAAHRLAGWAGLPGMLGMTEASLPARLLILGFVGSLAAFPLTPLGSWLSRRREWQADRYACALTGAPLDLASALVRLSRENLANLHPHPLYAWFHYSHPPLAQRVAALRARGKSGLDRGRRRGY